MVFGIRLDVHLTTTAHQAQNGVCGTGAQRLIRLLLNKVTARNLVEQLDQDREANGGVQVAFRNMEAKTFRHQAQTNHQQEAQTQHDHRRMLVNEARQRLRGQQHDRHRNDNSRHHYRQMIHHADRRDHRIQREDRIKHHDLQHYHPEAGIAFTVPIIVLTVFQPLV